MAYLILAKTNPLGTNHFVLETNDYQEVIDYVCLQRQNYLEYFGEIGRLLKLEIGFKRYIDIMINKKMEVVSEKTFHKEERAKSQKLAYPVRGTNFLHSLMYYLGWRLTCKKMPQFCNCIILEREYNSQGRVVL
jgi:hypothetical protein